MEIERFIELVWEYDKLAESLDFNQYQLYVEGGDEMHNLSPTGVRTCKKIQKTMWKLQTKMDALEADIVNFIQETHFERDLRLLQRLSSPKLELLEPYLKYDQSSWHIQLDDNRELCEIWS